MSLSLTRMICVALAVIGLSPVLAAQNANNPALPVAPVPPQIAAAKRVFIANGGGAALDDAMGPTIVKGGPDRAYNQFYAAMKSGGDTTSFPHHLTRIWCSRSPLS